MYICMKQTKESAVFLFTCITNFHAELITATYYLHVYIISILLTFAVLYVASTLATATTG